MAHTHAVTDSEPNFVVDAVTRKITTSSTITLVQYDHNSQRITFELPRHIEGHDMSKCNQVQVHYQNISGNKKNHSNGIYTISDLSVSPTDNNVLTCSWLVSRNATLYSGYLNFVVRFACVTDKITDYAWNTNVYSGLVISNGINNTSIVIDNTPDILTDHASRLETLENKLSSSVTSDTTAKPGLTVAVIGDSISTHPKKNVSEIVIEDSDVGVELRSFITDSDVGKTISLDGATSGYTIVANDVGTELTFKPCNADIGKKLGSPLNYNGFSNVWWQVAADALGFEPIAACWSGSSITSHTASSSAKAASYAWHDHTIRTLGKRIPGTMDRVPPDVVLIYRGTNDLSHSTKVRLTQDYFANADWAYPETDLLSDGSTFGYKEGLALTIKKIRATYPKAIIALCTCNVFKRNNCNDFPTNNGVFSIPQMNTAIREVANFFGCHTIDLDKCGITFENCYDEGYITDSSSTPTHPNESGHALMAKQAICDLVNKVHIYDLEPIAPPVVEEEEEDPETPNDNESTPTPDISTYIEGGIAINSSNGNTFSGSDYFSLIDYPIEAGATYSIPYGRNYGIRDVDGTVLVSGMGKGASDLQLTMPEGAVTLSICYTYADIAPENITVTKVESDNDTAGDESDTGDDVPTQVQIGDLQGTLMEGYYIGSTSSGVLNGSSNLTTYFCFTDIIVEPGVLYNTPYARNTAFYTADGTYISGISPGGTATGTLSVPATAHHMTVTYKYVDISPDQVTITKAG